MNINIVREGRLYIVSEEAYRREYGDEDPHGLPELELIDRIERVCEICRVSGVPSVVNRSPLQPE